MSSKKSKAKVSQADLRKMMHQMKNKKQEVSSSNEKLNNNNTAFLKRKILNPSNAVAQKVHISNNGTKNAISSSKLNSKTVQNLSNDKVKNIQDNKHLRNNHKEDKDRALEQPSKKLQKVTNVKKNKSVSSGVPLISAAYSDSGESSDEAVPSSSSASKKFEILEPKKPTKEMSLPAGFFDDPEIDAKIRGVETPADKMDREWESFQRELQHETGQSEQLIDEEQETGHIDREIDEIDEQIQFYSLIDKLCDKKESVVHKLKDKHSNDDEEAMAVDSSSEDDDDILDWREKDAFTW